MSNPQASRGFRRFARHLFLIGKVYAERSKAKQEMDSQLERMRRSIIRMRLSYTDIDTLKEKIEKLLACEGKYAKLFNPEDKGQQQLKSQLNAVEQQLKSEREEKQRMIEENNAKITQLTESLSNIKVKMNELLVERAKRHQRLTALDKKIREKVDVHKYYRP